MHMNLHSNYNPCEQVTPIKYITTTTETSSNATTQTVIRFDPSYIRTISGLLKCVQMVFDVMGFISMMCSNKYYLYLGAFYSTIAMGSFWFTAVMLAQYLYHVVEKFHNIPWLKIEFVFCAIWTILYLLAASLVTANGKFSDANIAAGFFGYIAMVLYGYDAFLKFTAIRSGAIAQG